MPGGGGGGGSGGSVQSTNAPAAGPARPLTSYPAYNPYALQAMQPGQLPQPAGMGSPIASYIPGVSGMQGFGGIPAQQLIQALLSGYAGVPQAQQPTGAGAPGVVTPPVPTTPPPGTGGQPGTGDGTGFQGRKRRFGAGENTSMDPTTLPGG